MPVQLSNLILRLIARRFTGSIELHFKDGTVHKVHHKEIVSISAPENQNAPPRTLG